MTQTISRLYSSPDSAADAMAELRSGGFADDAIHLVAPVSHQPTDAETPDDGIVASILAGGVPTAHAPTYADGIRRGETLVSVRAPFGFAKKAIEILTRFGPVETDLPDDGYEMPPRDPAAPLSSAWGWPVLSNNPTPLSSLLRLPTLCGRRSRPKPDHELIDDPAPFSKRIGMQVLLDNPAILSRRFGWRLLWDNPTPLSTRLGWPALSRERGPLSSQLGLKLLSDNPAPLSRFLGWRVLSDNPAPLSKRFGWRVLSSDPPKPPSWFQRLLS
jgi:hypothetical protein